MARDARTSWVVRWLGVIGGLVIASLLGLRWGYGVLVLADDPRFDREALLALVSEETPVYYRDGVTRLGVFFGDEHRTYLPWESLPETWVVSIVATEDHRFWRHGGLDGWGIARAMLVNLRHGGVVAGGSTLTQQTVKNLFYRPDRSVRAKVIEALNALRLEARQPKTKILELYANQFHVTGNGRGLAVAARHLFDKDLARAATDPSQELSLAEAAYLAGYVKGPANYDPHRGDADRRAAARERGLERARHVLRRIVQTPTRDLLPEGRDTPERVSRVRAYQAEAARLLEEGLREGEHLSFRRGSFRFPADVALDEVRRRLRQAPLADVLERHGGEDLERAGLKVITSLDVHAQRAAVYALRHHLTEVGVMVEGLDLDAWRVDAPRPPYDPDRLPVVGEVRRGVVTGESQSAQGRREILLDLGGHPCRVDRDGVIRVAAAIARGAAGRTSEKVGTEQVDAVVDGLPPGTVVQASVRRVEGEDRWCDLEAETSLQGAVVVSDRGQLRAMVGGRDNRDFNRARALRQFGSTWKTLVLHAALHHGWQVSDAVDNRRAVFPFSATAYAPSPNHDGPDRVSLGWSGVKSENVATVWLLYHLLDRLDVDAIEALAERHGLAREPDEDETAWRRRLGRMGIDLSAGALQEARFLAARDEVARGLPRGSELQIGVMSLQPDRPLRRARGVPTDAGAWTSAWRSRTVWSEVLERRDRCADAWAVAADAVDLGLPPPATRPPLAYAPPSPDGVIEIACGADRPGFGPFDASAWLTLPPEPVEADSSEPWDRFPVAPDRPPVRAVDLASVWMDGLTVGAVDAVVQAEARRARMEDILGDAPPQVTDPGVLYRLQDTRVLLALRELIALAQTYGVRSELEPLLSLPLGAREITLEEAVALYDGLTTGRRRTFPGLEAGPSPRDVASPSEPTLLIVEIRDVDDRVLYRARVEEEEEGDRGVARMTWGILEGVVQHGTGRRARGPVGGSAGAWPLAGKTGTTNAFRNAAFLGRVPRVDEAGRWDEGWVVGTYVGFDDNRRMVRRSIRLTGASGALPVWRGAVEGLARAGMLWPQGWRDEVPATALPDLVAVPVDEVTGLPLSEEVVPGDDAAPVLRMVAGQDQRAPGGLP